MDDTTDPAAVVPPTVALAWGHGAARRRGPRPTLTVARVVEAGMAVAGAEGIPAVSMARVATELDVGTMSLYRYVSAKDELLALMADTAVGDPPRIGAGDWKESLRGIAFALRAVYRRHPWLVDVPVTYALMLPHNIAWLETMLAALEGTALDPRERASAALLVAGYVRNAAETGNAVDAATDEADLMPGFAQVVRGVADPLRFPALMRTIDAGVFDEDDGAGDDEWGGEEYEFGVERIIDGLDTLHRRRSRAVRPKRDRS